MSGRKRARVGLIRVETISSIKVSRGLPTALPDFPRRAYLEALRVDKKRQESRIRYIALPRIGRAEPVSLTPAEILPARRGRRRKGH